MRLSAEERSLIGRTLALDAVPDEVWLDIESFGARYRREVAQERANKSVPRARQKAALGRIAELSTSLEAALSGLDDETSFTLKAADGGDLQSLHEGIAQLAQASRHALKRFGETRGQQAQLNSLRLLISDLGLVWRQATGQPVTLDRHKIDGRYVPISPSSTFFVAVVNVVDPDVTPQQLATVIQDVRG